MNIYYRVLDSVVSAPRLARYMVVRSKWSVRESRRRARLRKAAETCASLWAAGLGEKVAIFWTSGPRGTFTGPIASRSRPNTTDCTIHRSGGLRLLHKLFNLLRNSFEATFPLTAFSESKFIFHWFLYRLTHCNWHILSIHPNYVKIGQKVRMGRPLTDFHDYFFKMFKCVVVCTLSPIWMLWSRNST